MLTGCAAQINPQKFSAMSEVDYVIGNNEKLDFKTWSNIKNSKPVKVENIFANNFIYDNDDNIISVDDNNPLSRDKGKIEIAKNILGQNIIIGDGYTDYEIKKFGYAEKFIQFSENINRPILNSIADYTAYSFNDVRKYIENNL